MPAKANAHFSEALHCWTQFVFCPLIKTSVWTMNYNQYSMTFPVRQHFFKISIYLTELGNIRRFRGRYSLPYLPPAVRDVRDFDCTLNQLKPLSCLRILHTEWHVFTPQRLLIEVNLQAAVGFSSSYHSRWNVLARSFSWNDGCRNNLNLSFCEQTFKKIHSCHICYCCSWLKDRTCLSNMPLKCCLAVKLPTKLTCIIIRSSSVCRHQVSVTSGNTWRKCINMQPLCSHHNWRNH